MPLVQVGRNRIESALSSSRSTQTGGHGDGGETDGSGGDMAVVAPPVTTFGLYYEVHGSGPEKILFIGGFGNICHQWDYQVEHFAKLPEFSVCIFDNRGAGFSGVPKGRYKTSEMAKDAMELLDHLGWQKVHVVGVSMGGMIAQELAHLCRKRISSLTLESTFGYFNGLPRAGVKGMVTGGPKERTLDNFVRHFMKVLFPKEWLDAPCDDPKFATNADRVHAFGMERYEKTGLQDPVARASQQNACITHYMSPTRLNQIRDAGFPILVLTGDQDDVVIQPSSSVYLAKYLSARLEIWKGCGHAIRLQCPQRHNEFLESFLRDAIAKEQARRRDSEAAARASGAVGFTPMFVPGTNRWWSQLEETFLSHAAAISATSWIQVHRSTVQAIEILPPTQQPPLSAPNSPLLSPNLTHHSVSSSAMTSSSSSVSFTQLLSFSNLEGELGPTHEGMPKLELNSEKIDENSNHDDDDDDDDEAPENLQAAARRGFLPRFLPSLGGIRFGFTDFISMLTSS